MPRDAVLLIQHKGAIENRYKLNKDVWKAISLKWIGLEYVTMLQN